MTFRTMLSTAVCGAALMAAPAFAQDAPADDNERGATTDVITVTARKRDETLTDVPVSAAVISDAEAQALVLDEVDDYLRQIPGALLVSGGPPHLSDVSIRGQGGGRVGFSESATGIYRNGVFIAGGGYGGRAHTKLDFFDIERVEVYRGPQGALYGRNAIGGAINVISRRPNLDEAGGYVEAGYDNVETTSLEGVANIPLIAGKAALRVGGYISEQEDGFITLAGTGEALDQSSRTGGRISLRVDPDPLSSMTFTVEHRDDTTPGFGVLGYNDTLDPDPYTRVMDDTGDVKVQETQAFIDYSRDFSEFELLLVGNYRTRDAARDNEDLDHFQGWEPANAASTFRAVAAETEDFSRWGGEARLVSNNSGELRWLVGADVQSYEDDVSTQNQALAASGLLNLNDGRILPAAIIANVIRVDENFVEELFSYSAFGSVERDITDRVTASAELRVQRDEKDFVFTDLRSGLNFTLSESWTAVLPVLSLSYDVSDDHMLFTRFATGFRPGGFNAEGATPGFENLLAYDPERIYSLEGGWKGTLGGNATFNVTGFYSYTDDVQILTAEDITGTGRLSFILQNGGATKIWGVEAEMRARYQIGAGDLVLIAGIASTNGEFEDTQLQLVGSIVDLSGERVNRTRDYSIATSAIYSRPLTANLNGFGSISVQAEGGGYLNADRTSDNPAFERVDARLGVRNERISASVFARNLTEEEHVIQRIGGNEYYSERARIGAELRVSF